MIHVVWSLTAHLLLVCSFTRVAALYLQAAKIGRSVPQLGTVGGFDQCVDAYASGLESVRHGLAAYIQPHQARKTSLRNITFGVGAGSTGSSSLEAALVKMGIDSAHSYHYPFFGLRGWFLGLMTCPLHSPADRCFKCLREFNYTDIPDRFDAVLDDPVDTSFIDLFLSFPNAKWILHTRPSYEWAKARKVDHDGLFQIVPPPMEMPCLGNIGNFSIDELARIVELHDDLVRCAVPPKKLFEFDLFSNGSKGLMHDLGVFMELPDPPSKTAPYPHLDADDLMRPPRTW